LPTLFLSMSKAATKLDVADVVAAEIDVHEAGDEVGLRRVLVVVAALDQAAGAVADAHDGDADLVVPEGLRPLPIAVAGAFAASLLIFSLTFLSCSLLRSCARTCQVR